MRNHQASKRPIIRKSAKTDDILTIFFQNINAVLEEATTLNTTFTTWNMIIISIDLFQGLSQGLRLGERFLFRFLSDMVFSGFLGTRYAPLSLKINFLKFDIFSWGYPAFTPENVPSIL